MEQSRHSLRKFPAATVVAGLACLAGMGGLDRLFDRHGRSNLAYSVRLIFNSLPSFPNTLVGLGIATIAGNS